jgi:hypothetical protein
MRERERAGLGALILALSIGPTAAWAPETRIRMIDEAVRLMPASLRMALEQHRDPLLRGALEPMTHEGEPGHLPPWAAGNLAEVVETESAALGAALAAPGSFSGTARRFGVLAHYVLDSGFPPLAGGSDDEQRYEHFTRFCASRCERFPTVFYGHDDPSLAAGDYRAFAVRALERARENDVELARAYAAAGDPPDPDAFDDRSLPFAIGSISYSRSITNVVRVWLAVWSRAGGDMGRIPYWKPGSAEVESGRP